MKIDIIDDDPDCAELLKILLSRVKPGARIQLFHSGQEAIANLKLRDKSEMPELIFLDLNLGKDHGLDLLPQIRKEPLGLTAPVIIITSSEEKSDVANSYKKGASVFLKKPFTQENLKDVIHQMELSGLLKPALRGKL